jgi:cobalt/nickel transport system permease protein
MYFLILSTPQHEFDFILKTLKVPAVMRELCTLVYRNIFILIGMAESVYVAQRLRLGYANFPRSVRSSGGLISSVLIKSLDFGRRSYVAMRARGYTGEMAFVGGGYRFRFHHVLGTAGAGVLFIFIVIWSRS